MKASVGIQIEMKFLLKLLSWKSRLAGNWSRIGSNLNIEVNKRVAVIALGVLESKCFFSSLSALVVLLRQCVRLGSRFWVNVAHMTFETIHFTYQDDATSDV